MLQHDVSSSPSIGVKGSELQIVRRSRCANMIEFKLINQIFSEHLGKPSRPFSQFG
jgi:hypothetical protein